MPQPAQTDAPEAIGVSAHVDGAADGETGAELWRSALRVGALLLVPVGLVAFAIGGTAGLASGLAGFALVVGNVAGGAYLFARTRHGDVATTAAIGLGGYFVKIVLLGVAIVVLRPRDIVHGPALAVGVVVPLIVLLIAQVRAASHDASLWWLVRGRNHG